MAEKKPAKRPMSDDHKAALAAGRNEGRAVRRYLEALEAHKPKRGRKRTPESIQKRLARHRGPAARRRPAEPGEPHPGADGPDRRARHHGGQGRPHRARAGVRQGGQGLQRAPRASATRRGGRPACPAACSSRPGSAARCRRPAIAPPAGPRRAPARRSSPAADDRPARGGASAPPRCGPPSTPRRCRRSSRSGCST